MTDCFILPSDFIIGEGSLEPCPAIPTKPDYNTRWLERSTTYHLPNVTFSFEATYPNPNGTDINFGFNIKWQRLPYTLRYTQRYMAYCVVAAVSPDFSNVIAKGDIVLRINEENLFYHHGEEIPDEEVLAKKLEGRKLSTATLRFLRIASNSTNAMVSPSEIQLFSQEKNTTAKFTLKPSKDSPTRMVLESTNIETSTPQPVRHEARKNIQRAQAAAELYQTFDPYYFIKEVTKKTAPIITIPTAAAAQGPTILTINTSAVPSAAAINRSNTTGAAPSSTAAPLN
eukprot:gene362-238_t